MVNQWTKKLYQTKFISRGETKTNHLTSVVTTEMDPITKLQATDH